MRVSILKQQSVNTNWQYKEVTRRTPKVILPKKVREYTTNSPPPTHQVNRVGVEQCTKGPSSLALLDPSAANVPEDGSTFSVGLEEASRNTRLFGRDVFRGRKMSRVFEKIPASAVAMAFYGANDNRGKQTRLAFEKGEARKCRNVFNIFEFISRVNLFPYSHEFKQFPPVCQFCQIKMSPVLIYFILTVAAPVNLGLTG